MTRTLMAAGALVIAGMGFGFDRALAVLNSDQDVIRSGTYGDWSRVSWAFSQESTDDTAVSWSVLEITQNGEPSQVFVDNTAIVFLHPTTDVDPYRQQATLRIDQVGNGPPVGTYTITVEAIGATTSTDEVTFVIERREVFIEGGFTAESKEYDGDTTVDAINATGLGLSADDRVTGVKSGDDVTLVPVATFTSPQAGDSPVTVILSDPGTPSRLEGDDAGNYELMFTDAPTAEAIISRKELTLTGLSVTKTYDGQLDATVSGTPTPTGKIGNDAVIIQGEVTWAFLDKNVGSNKPLQITSGSYLLQGNDAGNYTLAPPTLTGEITPATLTVSISVADKEYDGTPSATVSVVSEDSVAGDQITITLGPSYLLSECSGQ